MTDKKKRYSAFTIYLLAVLLLWIKTYVVYKWVFDLHSKTIIQEIVLFFNSLGSVAFLLGVGFLFTKKVRPKVIVLIHFLLTFLLYGNVLYYRFYIDFITLPVLFQFKNVGGLSQSTVELINLPDPLLFLDVVLLLWLIKRKNIQHSAISFRSKMAVLATSLMLIVVPLTASFIENPGFITKSYDRELLVKGLGTYNYHLYDILLNSKASMNRVLADGTDTEEIDAYLSKKDTETSSDVKGAAKGKNLILISLESTQQFVIGKEIGGKEVTPFLNDLIKESFYFPNFYHQTAQGKTSDAEFIIDNSLYPLSGGSVFVRRPDNEFYALPEILKEKGYYAASFHGNDREFWNREVMYKTLGYDRYFSKRDFNVTEQNSVNYGLKDIPFFQQSVPYLEELPQPFYAKFLTLTNHFPFLLNDEDKYIPEAETEEGVVNRYFTTVRYTDEALKQFFADLKEKGLYENSIFVLYGDHYGISKSYSEALGNVLNEEINPSRHVAMQKVPLIIHVPGMEGKKIDTVGGQIDLRPTILSLLGVDPEYNTLSFGTSLFAKDREERVIFRDGSFVTDKYVYTENTCYDKKTDEKVKRNKCTPYFSEVQKELGYSDKVILGDLLRFTGKK
ncbi:LTA synthase family protein [Pseudalkalibacillus caeni]|uniref:LTA synthase family protein n=2 Tax=Exobacillus caeni TaxID=2574798 RepID=A0A5R9F8N5_9BACL|nr:LTA synthase family protein [Pseudalkalibacillus caeni]